MLEDAPLGLYAVVPPHPEHQIIAPGVVFCLKQKGDAKGGDTVNPLQPYYLVYVRDDGTVRFSFAQPKQILEIFRLLCSGKAAAYEQLCQLFDNETKNGADMSTLQQAARRRRGFHRQDLPEACRRRPAIRPRFRHSGPAGAGAGNHGI